MSENPDEKNKRCFVISPIGEAGTNTRKHMDMVFEYIIKPAVTDMGYDKPIRSDHDHDPGLITERMIKSIVTDGLVIAILTELNPNVFYELGIRHSMQKPVIHLCAHGTNLPFDNTDQRTIFYDANDVSSHKKTIEAIKSQLVAIQKEDFVVSNPVTQYKDSLSLRESGNPTDRRILELEKAISRLSLEVSVAKQPAPPQPSYPRAAPSPKIEPIDKQPLADYSYEPVEPFYGDYSEETYYQDPFLVPDPPSTTRRRRPRQKNERDRSTGSRLSGFLNGSKDKDDKGYI